MYLGPGQGAEAPLHISKGSQHSVAPHTPRTSVRVQHHFMLQQQSTEVMLLLCTECRDARHRCNRHIDTCKICCPASLGYPSFKYRTLGTTHIMTAMLGCLHTSMMHDPKYRAHPIARLERVLMIPIHSFVLRMQGSIQTKRIMNIRAWRATKVNPYCSWPVQNWWDLIQPHVMQPPIGTSTY